MKIGRVYRWEGPDGVVVEARPYELREQYGLAWESVKAMSAGRQRTHRGWRCLNPRRELHIGEQPGGCQVLRLHLWHGPERSLVETVDGLARLEPELSRRCLWSVARGLIQEHQGWRHGRVVAEWPRAQLTVQMPTGGIVRKTAEQLWRELLRPSDIGALLTGQEVHGMRVTDYPGRN